MEIYFAIPELKDARYQPSTTKHRLVFIEGVSDEEKLNLTREFVYWLQRLGLKAPRSSTGANIAATSAYQAMVEICLDGEELSQKSLGMPTKATEEVLSMKSQSAKIVDVVTVTRGYPEFDLAFNCTTNGFKPGSNQEWLVANKAFHVRVSGGPDKVNALKKLIAQLCTQLIAENFILGRYDGKQIHFHTLNSQGARCFFGSLTVPSRLAAAVEEVAIGRAEVEPSAALSEAQVSMSKELMLTQMTQPLFDSIDSVVGMAAKSVPGPLPLLGSPTRPPIARAMSEVSPVRPAAGEFKRSSSMPIAMPLAASKDLVLAALEEVKALVNPAEAAVPPALAGNKRKRREVAPALEIIPESGVAEAHAGAGRAVLFADYSEVPANQLAYQDELGSWS